MVLPNFSFFSIVSTKFLMAMEFSWTTGKLLEYNQCGEKGSKSLQTIFQIQFFKCSVRETEKVRNLMLLALSLFSLDLNVLLSSIPTFFQSYVRCSLKSIQIDIISIWKTIICILNIFMIMLYCLSRTKANGTNIFFGKCLMQPNS